KPASFRARRRRDFLAPTRHFRKSGPNLVPMGRRRLDRRATQSYGRTAIAKRPGSAGTPPARHRRTGLPCSSTVSPNTHRGDETTGTVVVLIAGRDQIGSAPVIAGRAHFVT